MNARRQAPFDLLQIFEHARARPVEVGAVLEDDENVGIAEHRLRPHSFHMGGGQKRRDDRIGDLVFNDVGRLPVPWRVDNDLHIGDIGQRIERECALESPDTSQHQRKSAGEYKKAVAGAPVDPACDHLAPAITTICFCARVCPFFVASTVTCHVPPI